MTDPSDDALIESERALVASVLDGLGLPSPGESLRHVERLAADLAAVSGTSLGQALSALRLVLSSDQPPIRIFTPLRPANPEESTT